MIHFYLLEEFSTITLVESLNEIFIEKEDSTMNIQGPQEMNLAVFNASGGKIWFFSLPLKLVLISTYVLRF